jgi:hypothetical protein
MGSQAKGSLRQAWLYRFHVTRTNLAAGLLAKSYIILKRVLFVKPGHSLGSFIRAFLPGLVNTLLTGLRILRQSGQL